LLAFASRRGTPPTKADLVGLWIGYEQSYPYFYRLNLRDNNTGSLIILYPERNAVVYRLRWELTHYQLSIQSVPMRKDTERISCSVTKANYQRIDLVTSGISNQWKRTALLLNQKELFGAISESAEYEENEAGERMAK
jgi:hypothetical protein